MSSTVYNVFIGSTSKDLLDYRAAAREICESLHMFPIMMEDFPSMAVGATAASLKLLADADVYVGIIGFRYGFIENPTDGRSVTEIEYDEAAGIDRLCFLADKNAPFPYNTIDTDHHDQLKQFRAKVSRDIVRFFPDVATFKVDLMQALINWRDGKLGITRQSTVIVGTLAQDPADLKPYKPTKLIGRDKLFGQIAGWIANGDKILLHGFGGMGKTALAATAAASFLDTEVGRRVVWARIRSQPAAEIFIGLAHAFGPDAARQLTATPDEHKPRALCDLLKSQGVRLIVLDDAWDGPALFAVLRGLPDDLPVLVTSRHRYPIEGRIATVDKLGPNDAVAVLAYYAGRDDLAKDFDAFALCKTLGHHAFALEIAGKTLLADGINPDILEERIHDAPHQMALPLDYADPERESVAQLLEVSLDALDEEARKVFLAFGAFFVPSATPELLARFLNTSPAPPHIVERGEWSVGDVEKLLTVLVRRGLADYIPPTDEAIATYRVHDLAQSYACAQQPLEARQRALQACLDYTEAYNEPSLKSFAALVPEIDQCVAASHWAMDQQLLEEVERFALNLYLNSGLLDYRGFFQQAITLLAIAAAAAEKRGNLFNRGTFLDNIATIYRQIGQVEQAIEYYDQALKIAREIGNRTVEGTTLGNLGSAYAVLGETKQAIGLYEEALAIAHEVGDMRGEGNHLGNLGNAHANWGETKQAITLYEESLAIAREIGDKRGEGNQLGNLGIASFDLGEIQQAIDYYQLALQIAREIGDKRSEGNQLGNLGIASFDLGEIQQAIDYYQLALQIAREIGDKRNEGNQLGNLGNAYGSMGEMQQAITYLQQALAIRRGIGDRMGESNDLNNLGVAFEAVEQYEQALDYFQQARVIRVAIGAKHLIEKGDECIARVQAKLRGE